MYWEYSEIRLQWYVNDEKKNFVIMFTPLLFIFYKGAFYFFYLFGG